MKIDRFTAALYTKAEVADYLRISPSTLGRWSGTDRLVTSIDAQGRQSSIPFVGLAQAYALRAFSTAGVSMQRIRPALEILDSELGLDYALASNSLYTDGAEVLFDYSRKAPSNVGEAINELVVVRNRQHVFVDVVQDLLTAVQFDDGYASVIPLPAYGNAGVVVDFRRGFGQPVFEDGGARVADVMSLFRAGESLQVVAEEYGLLEDRLEEALRGLLPRAA